MLFTSKIIIKDFRLSRNSGLINLTEKMRAAMRQPLHEDNYLLFIQITLSGKNSRHLSDELILNCFMNLNCRMYLILQVC